MYNKVEKCRALVNAFVLIALVLCCSGSATGMKRARRLSLLLWRTRSPAIAERGRAMSIVSFNSTTPRAQSYIICYFGFRFTTAFNYILFCCLRCNVEVSCHKQDSPISGAASSVSRNQQIPPLNVLTYTTPPSNC